MESSKNCPRRMGCTIKAMNRKLLCLCDSPTLETGFGRVAQNLIGRWLRATEKREKSEGESEAASQAFFEQIWVWGIGYNGFPHRFAGLENRIFPASSAVHPLWHDPANLRVFTAMIGNTRVGGTEGGFTHLWMLQDTFQLANTAGAIRQVCLRAKAASFFYFPVDAPLAPAWTTIIAGVDTAVAYCDYGREETVKALKTPMFVQEAHDKKLEKINLRLGLISRKRPWLRSELTEEREAVRVDAENTKAVDAMREQAAPRLLVLPHGVDTSVYRPLPEEKYDIRKKLFQDKVKPTDFLILNVSQHQKRKGLAQSLLVLRDIQAMRPELSAKLYLHAASVNSGEGTNLRDVATQLGFEDGVDVFYGDQYFANNYAMTSEETLNKIYNAADLLLSTSYGEGWGMPLTEAMAAGIPVAGPRHTSVAEILGSENLGNGSSKSQVPSSKEAPNPKLQGGEMMESDTSSFILHPSSLDRGIIFDTMGWDMMVGDNSLLRPRADTNDAARRIIAAATVDPGSSGSLASYAKRGLEWARSDFLNWDRIAGEWLKLFDGIAL